MGILLNPKPTLFERALNSKIYVDKSLIIEKINELINTENLFICVSRPRRFGKTMTANMLSAYYGKDNNTHNLFDNLKISNSKTYESHINNYNVIYLTMTKFFNRMNSADILLKNLENDIIEELCEKYPTIYSQGYSLIKLLEKIYSVKEEQFIFIIDEWDCIFRVFKDDSEMQTLYLDFLRNLLKDQPYVALVYMTGILPIKKYGEHSALNMFDEFSMINMDVFAEYTGFTEYEVEDLCLQYDMDYDKMETWYDGYIINDIHIYNPRAVVSAILRNKFSNYWTSTETFEALKIYVNYNMEGLKDAIVKLLAGDTVKINPSKFQNDMTTFTTKDDILTLLVHLGYLGYIEHSSVQGEVFLPNEEIKMEFSNTIEDQQWGKIATALQNSDNLLEATLDGRSEDVANYIEDVHSDITSILKYNDENSLSCVITVAYYTATKYYTMIREFPTGKGFADIVFLPRKGVDKPAIIMELKFDQDVETAMNQILINNYAQNLEEYKGRIIFVAINYNRKTKKHECLITKDIDYNTEIKDIASNISAKDLMNIFSTK